VIQRSEEMEMKEINRQIDEIDNEDPLVDELCKQMKKSTRIFYDERKELEFYLEKKNIDQEDIKQTTERYERYLRGIEVWERGRKSLEYIRDDIIKYLSLNLTMVSKINLMRKIDKDLMDVLLNKK
jgi:hypothetical protein